MTDTSPWELGREETQLLTPADSDLVMIVPAGENTAPRMRGFGHLLDDVGVGVFRGTFRVGESLRPGDMIVYIDRLYAARTAIVTTAANHPGGTSDNGTLWLSLTPVVAVTATASETPAGFAEAIILDGGRYNIRDADIVPWARLDGDPIPLTAADLHSAYFPEHARSYGLPDDAGAYELAILDPVNIALELVDGDQFIVHAAISGIPDDVTTELQIRGRDTTTVTTDSVPFAAQQRFCVLTLDTPGDEEDRTWVLYVRGTKPATAAASIGVTLREVVGVRGGTQPFAGVVGQMIEDYAYSRLREFYGITHYQSERLHYLHQLVLDPTDGNVYRFREDFGHSSAVPSANATQWLRMTWPQPANWALTDPDADGLTVVPPARIQYRLPPVWDTATAWPNGSEVLHANAVWQNSSGGPLTGIEPAADTDWTRRANFTATDADVLALVADWAEQSNEDAPNPVTIPNRVLRLLPRWVYETNPADDADGEAMALRLYLANEASPLLRGATTTRAGLLTAAEHTKLAALTNPNPRGPWTEGVAYLPGDWVWDYNPQTGITTIAFTGETHVAAVSNRPNPQSDSARWERIGVISQSPHARTTEALDARIVAQTPTPAVQFRWRNVWTAGLDYLAGDVVTREVGAVAVLAQSRTDHRSSDGTAPGTTTTDEWRILWSYDPAAAATKLNNLADAARLSYESLKDKPTIPDTTTTGFRWAGHWQPLGVAYPTGVTVGIGSRLYTSTASVQAGTETNPATVPSDDSAPWTEIMAMQMQITPSGVLQFRWHFGAAGTGGQTDWVDVNDGGLMIWRGAWAGGATFNVDNLCEDRGWIWRCVTPHAASATNRPPHAYWSRFAASNTGPERTMVWYGAWVSNRAFQEGHVVLRSAHVYIAHNDAPAGNEPGVSTQWGSYWTRIV